MGVIMAPPMPWMIRETTNMGTLTDRPHSSEPKAKTEMAWMKMRWVPNRSAIQPLIGMNTARARV